MELVTPRSGSPAAIRMHDRILEAASRLLAEGGVDAVSNRTVAQAAGTQAPTIYRLFGDKQGLLDAVAMHGFTDHLIDKAALAQTDDPVQDLRDGWDHHIAFGLQNPNLYALVYGRPRPDAVVPAATAAAELLAGYVHRVAQAGRLRVKEAIAAQLIHATGRGVTLTLLGTPEQYRDLQLSALARDTTINAITRDAPLNGGSELVEHAIGMLAVLPDTTVLSNGERALMTELLDRIAG